MSSYQYLRIRREESVAVVTLDNPPLNLLKKEILEEIEKVADELEGDPDVRGVVIVGAGNYAFSAGADVKSFQALQPEQAIEIVQLGHRAFNKIENLSKPTVAAINGLALGGGNELAMACDMRVSSDRARFGQPEVNLGLIPGWGGTQRMARLIGRAKAKELIFTGNMISAQEALRIGLVNKIVPDGEELRAAMDIIRQVTAKSAPLAVKAAKKAINEGLQRSSFEEALKVEVEAVRDIAGSQDLKEGIEAFLQKRQPKYRGE